MLIYLAQLQPHGSLYMYKSIHPKGILESLINVTLFALGRKPMQTRANMQTQPRKAPKWESSPAPSCCGATVLTRKPMCRPHHSQSSENTEILVSIVSSICLTTHCLHQSCDGSSYIITWQTKDLFYPVSLFLQCAHPLTILYALCKFSTIIILQVIHEVSLCTVFSKSNTDKTLGKYKLTMAMQSMS